MTHVGQDAAKRMMLNVCARSSLYHTVHLMHSLRKIQLKHQKTRLYLRQEGDLFS